MALQEITAPVGKKYTVRGWLEGNGDPSIEIQIAPGGYDGDLLSLASVAESVRSLALAVPDIETVEVRLETLGTPTNEIVPAP